jgi:hypothetical protein
VHSGPTGIWLMHPIGTDRGRSIAAAALCLPLHRRTGRDRPARRRPRGWPCPVRARARRRPGWLAHGLRLCLARRTLRPGNDTGPETVLTRPRHEAALSGSGRSDPLSAALPRMATLGRAILLEHRNIGGFHNSDTGTVPRSPARTGGMHRAVSAYAMSALIPIRVKNHPWLGAAVVMPTTGSSTRWQAPVGMHDFPRCKQQSHGWRVFTRHDEGRDR